MGIVRHRKIFFIISGTLIAVSVIMFVVWGLRFGIDFAGGSLLEVEFAQMRPPEEAVTAAFHAAGIDHVAIQPTEDLGYIFRFADVTEDQYLVFVQQLHAFSASDPANTLTEKQFTSIGPVIGSELKRHSLIALFVAIIAIILYIAWSFRHVSQPVSSWKYGVVTIVTLLHDVTIPTGVFVVLGHVRDVEVGILFITAILTILGFSVHDTIVVFDRIRENLSKLKRPESYEITVGRSVNETIARSINTSLTALLVLVAVFIWGGETTRYFTLALMIGVAVGTYSSIFVASPLLVAWDRIAKKRGTNSI